MPFALRPADVHDAESVTRIHVASRASYYGAALDPADAALDRLPMWRRLVADADTWVLLAELDNQPVGFLAASEHETAGGDAAELLSPYVLPALFGRGIGGALHERFDERFRGRPAHLEVWGGNERAQTFYRTRGWRPTSQLRPGPAETPFVTWRRPPTEESAITSSR